MRNTFNKIKVFAGSMKFGLILLVLIGICSVPGSLIAQGEDAAFYAVKYPDFHRFIFALGLDHVFTTPVYTALLALLCVNLLLCSIVRIRKTICCKGGGIGRYGSFIIHLSILLVIIFGACALYLPVVTDETCFPGESILMDDGTEIFVHDFSILDETGTLDYASHITVTLPDGKSTGEKRVSVNHPVAAGDYKIFQQTYGTAGSVTVRNLETGGEDTLTLDDVCFLSVDSLNGIWYEALYPDYERDEEGNFSLVSSTSGRYENPVYQILIASDGEYTPVLAFPGESVQTAGMEFTFNDPVEYPGLRMKKTPVAVNVMLVVSFIMMIAGLYITFFLRPAAVILNPEDYSVAEALAPSDS